MKYLEFESLEEINSALAGLYLGDCRVFGRVEAYSCKNTNEEKKLRHRLDAKYEEDSHSLSLGSSLGEYATSISPTSPFGPLTEPMPRKTLFYLIATLNAAYPDFDFSDIDPSTFVKLTSLTTIHRRLEATLFNISEASASRRHHVSVIHAAVWSAIDAVIDLPTPTDPNPDCALYEFRPAPESDPNNVSDADDAGGADGAGVRWSFCFLLFNRRRKRVVMFACRAVSLLAPGLPEEVAEEEWDDDMETPVDFWRDRSLSYEQYTMQSMEM
ncbi:Maf1 regulator-domain-containing protein [Zopfochytrium polystomum]|nr:Maf1 regulator-domain-containing protein [Zopfochytrium polystomum]